jgi:threonine/homoserine/homoserine lactone efflux protein
MAESLAAILPIAVGIILSPLPVVAVILMLFSSRARANGLAFLAGWAAGLAAVGALTLLLASTQDVEQGGTPARWTLALKLLLGAGLLFLAYRSFEKRPREGEEPSLPGWMRAVDAFTAPRALGLAALLSGVNPKNLLLTVSAMTGVALAGLPAGQSIVLLVVFVLASSLGVAVPVAYALLGGESARATLDGWKTWLAAHNSVVMAVVLLVLGVKIFFEALAGLVG